ncbi:MAG TPA: hypothetical protein VF733_03325 [Candidatus Saccharimonadales bacterium]
MNILRSALGRYEPMGFPEYADCVIGHSFGTNIGPAGVNAALAGVIAKHAQDKPIIVDEVLANAFSADQRAPDLIVTAKTEEDVLVEERVSTTFGRGVGTWGTLLAAKDFMQENQLERPLMVAHAHHVGRIVMQGEHKDMQMSSIVLGNLPRQFDRDSAQWWTRSVALWLLREIPGAKMLRAQGKL